MLERWARFVYRRKAHVLVASALILVAAGAVLAGGGHLVTWEPPGGTDSGRAIELIREEISVDRGTSFILIFRSSTLEVRDDAFRDAMQAALAPLRSDSRVTSIETPYDTGSQAPTRISKDGRAALAIVHVGDLYADAAKYYPELRDRVRSNTLEVLGAGDLALQANFDQILAEDLGRAEVVSLPLTLFLLVLVFGSAVAALLPVGVGGLAVATAVAGVFVVSRWTDMSLYAVNIVTLIGLGVAIDYSLFIVARHREEREKGREGEDALVRTLATAGRATLFSGLTVAIGLSGLAFYRGLYFASMGIGGALAVGFAVIFALSFLPALLAVLGPRVDRFRLPWPKRRAEGGLWRRIAHGVMAKPLMVLVPIVILLLVAGAPFLRMHLASPGVEQLPVHAEARRGEAILTDQFPAHEVGDVIAVVKFAGDPLTSPNVGALYDWTRAVERVPHVDRVQSLVNLDPRLAKGDYQAMYGRGRENVPAQTAEIVEQTVAETIVLVSVYFDVHPTSDEAREAVHEIRALSVAGGQAYLTGPTAIDVDTLEVVKDRTPIAVATILLATYVLIMLQTRSIVLPLKAIVMNVLSIAASFGAIVWIFQDGHLSSVLDFAPTAIDPGLPVMLFTILFGLSMDYEVLLLSRMHEEYERSGDNTQAVAEGLELSGRLITSAALIMVVVFSAFAMAQVVFIKAIGFGLALAVAIDATLVRALVVPAAMRLMGDVNWWGPRFLARRSNR